MRDIRVTRRFCVWVRTIRVNVGGKVGLPGVRASSTAVDADIYEANDYHKAYQADSGKRAGYCTRVVQKALIQMVK